MAMCKTSTSVHFVRQTTVVRERQAHWVPNTDVYTTDEGLVIKMELAGMQSENLQITVENGNVLCISGQRGDGCRAAKFNFLAMEINYGSFEKIIEIPSGFEVGRAKASYLNGFLRIDVPPMGKASFKRNKVTVAAK